MVDYKFHYLPLIYTIAFLALNIIEKTYQFGQYLLNVTLREKIVQIPNSPELRDFIGTNRDRNIGLLFDAIQNDYQHIYGRTLAIQRRSFQLEVWAHVFAEDFANKLEQQPYYKIFKRLCTYVKKHTYIIDCGEAPKDRNRKFWDRLAFILK